MVGVALNELHFTFFNVHINTAAAGAHVAGCAFNFGALLQGLGGGDGIERDLAHKVNTL